MLFRSSSDSVAEALYRAAAEPELRDIEAGAAVSALHNAFWHLMSGMTFEEALISTVARGGDTDTDAAIAGALIGAARGRGAIPPRWALPVLTCRPEAELGAMKPRPEIYWADDICELAEALLSSRGDRM